MDQTRLDAIRARCEAATPGPWTLEKMGRYEDHDECRIELADDSIELSRYENGEFVAASRTDVPDLLQKAQQLTADLAAMTAERDAWRRRAEVVHAKWTRIGKRGPVFVCDACHKVSVYKTDYCQNCGARMDGKER